MGGLLQVLGVLSVAWGIRHLRQSFGLAPIRGEIFAEIIQAIVNLWHRGLWLFSRDRRDVTATATGVSTQGSVSSSGRLTIRPGPNMSVEKRLEFLERRFDELEDMVYTLQSQHHEEIRLRAEAITAERRDRESGIADIRLQIRDVTIGGVRLQIVGLLWLLVGLILANWSQEITHLFAG
jgi:hypothetical protein